MATPLPGRRSTTLVGVLLACVALVLLAVAWGEQLDPDARTGYGIVVDQGASGPYVADVVAGSSAERAGIKTGDGIDVKALSLSDRLRFETGSPVGTVIPLQIRHDGVWRVVDIASGSSVSRSRILATSGWWLVVGATITLLILGFVALRRPSIGTAALLLYGCGAITTFGASAEFSFLPDPVYGGVATFIISAFSELPLFALLPFVVRFPHEPTTRASVIRMRVADAIFFAGAIFFTAATLVEPVIFQSWGTLHDVVDILGAIIVFVFAILAYRDESGESQRRIAWVIAGFVVSTIAYEYYDFFATVNFVVAPPIAIEVLAHVSQLLQCALPIALAYAILRHRVLDVGFALNRSVVYAVLTTIIVCLISLVDWITGRLLSEQRLALALDALATIAVGLWLNRLHAGVERIVDRTVFRQRHVAERRIDHRIDALAFASSEATVDDALANDAVDIIGLGSGAVFRRRTEDGDFERTAATGWSAASARTIEKESLLVRSMLSAEHAISLPDLAIEQEGLPTGEATPVLAVPINSQHELLGFALYGNRRDGAALDPTEAGLLARLVSAAGIAYGVVEARRWRKRAAELEGAVMAPAGD